MWLLVDSEYLGGGVITHERTGLDARAERINHQLSS
ncbi:protein of unknown function [Vibrio tapetis subsp. tapetis]|uniref:Uncharacterized protein n=1 Tax=Vibrio tapetis subsp. tapetis TaxID=1671868 RepID=A0A2N8Z8A2_9VIBR|nr:protein of unknown function [Vibrio tapetis subsp. tapetis]